MTDLAARIDDIDGENPFDIGRLRISMRRACRNLVSGGLVMQAVSAVDIALWDLKARLLAVPLAVLFGTVRSAILRGDPANREQGLADLVADLATAAAAIGARI